MKFVITEADTTLHSISYFLLLINIHWSTIYRWAVKVERLTNNKIMLGHYAKPCDLAKEYLRALKNDRKNMF